MSVPGDVSTALRSAQHDRRGRIPHVRIQNLSLVYDDRHFNAFISLLFISQREIKSGIHEPRIGNAVLAGDAGECDAPTKV